MFQPNNLDNVYIPDQRAKIQTSQERAAEDVSTILKLIKGKRPAVHGTKLNRKQCKLKRKKS